MKKIGLILVVIVLALGAIGAGYATWSQNFNISGTVSTGSYIVNIASDGAPTTFPTDQTTAIVTGPTFKSSGSGAGFSLTISNAYPGFSCTIPYIITSTGTIPAKVSGYSVKLNGVLAEGWDGFNPLGITLPGGTPGGVDVIVENTLTPWIYTGAGSHGPPAQIYINIGDPLPTTTYGSLVISIPNIGQDANGNNIDAGGLNTNLAQETFNFEIDTVQDPGN